MAIVRYVYWVPAAIVYVATVAVYCTLRDAIVAAYGVLRTVVAYCMLPCTTVAAGSVPRMLGSVIHTACCVML